MRAVSHENLYRRRVAFGGDRCDYVMEADAMRTVLGRHEGREERWRRGKVTVTVGQASISQNVPPPLRPFVPAANCSDVEQLETGDGGQTA